MNWNIIGLVEYLYFESTMCCDEVSIIVMYCILYIYC
jgi:hypothetical protein